jgi:hypothetical protein
MQRSHASNALPETNGGEYLDHTATTAPMDTTWVAKVFRPKWGSSCEPVRMTQFPRWAYFPRNSHPPEWVRDLGDGVAAVENAVSTVGGGRLESNEVLQQLAPALVALGYTVEAGKRTADKIRRPVLFGDNGTPSVTMEVDAFHDSLGVALEVEAGRGVERKRVLS